MILSYTYHEKLIDFIKMDTQIKISLVINMRQKGKEKKKRLNITK